MEVFRELVATVKLFHRYLLEIGSTPAEGSSKNATLGLPIIAIATHILRLFPPLKTPALMSIYSFKERRFP